MAKSTLVLGILLGVGLVAGLSIYFEPIESIPPTNAFSQVFVGSDKLLADKYNDVLSFVAGSGMTITSNENTDTITFSSTGGPGGAGPLEGLTNTTSIGCAENQVLKVNSTAFWNCAADVGGAGDNLGDHLATQGLDINTHYIDIENSAVPSPPAADNIRISAFTFNNSSRIITTDEFGNTLTALRDNVLSAQAGENLAKGDIVYISGVTGLTPIVSKFIADGSIPIGPLGVMVVDITSGLRAQVMIMGQLGLDMTGLPAGSEIYASAVTPGAMTTTPPAHPNLRAKIGTVIQTGPTFGFIEVEPLLMKGDHVGTNQNSWLVGSNTAGTKELVFRNGFDYNLTANPTANRVMVLPDANGNILYDGSSLHNLGNVTNIGCAANEILKVSGTSWVCAADDAGGGGVPDGDKTDITVSGGGTVWTIDPNVVTYAKMQDVSATARFLGRFSGGAGDPQEITGTQATTLIDVFTSALKGLAPASGGGTTNFLRADGTWAAPPSGSGGPSVLGADITCTLTATYCTIWTIPLTASSGNALDVYMIGDSNTAGSAIQMRVQFDNAGNDGYCTYRTYTTATAEVLDVLRATATTDTGETIWLAPANIPMPLRIQCGFQTDASPGNALVQVQMEVASTGTIQAGSYYVKTP